jgi:predicted ester cyclase
VSEGEEKNKALTRWWWEEVWVKGNVAAVDEFIAANYVDHPSLPGLPPGPEGMKQALTYYRTAFHDLKATVDDIFAGGDRVALRWSARATHLGEWLGVPPTGYHGTMSGITIYRIAEGKAVEGWNCIEVNPTEEEQRWLTEGGGWPGRSGDIPATERDPSPPFWDVLTRNLTWYSRVAEARERERIEQELQVARQIQRALLPEATPELDGPRRGGRHRQGHACCLGDVHDARHAAGRRSVSGVAGRGIGKGQRGRGRGHTPEHVCDLPLRHPRSGRRSAAIRKRRP